MLHRSEVDVARRLATCAANLQPGEAAIDGLVDGRGRIDRFAVARHPLVPLSQSSLSACRIIADALARISADCAARMLAIARALPSSFWRALRSPPDTGVGWCFGAIRTSNQTTRSRRRRRLLERGPATVLFVAAGPLLAGIVQQALRDVLEDRVRAVEADRIDLLDLNNSAAAGARHS